MQKNQLNMSIHALFEKPIPYHNLDNNNIAAAEQACLLPSMECGSTDDMRRLSRRPLARLTSSPPARSLPPPTHWRTARHCGRPTRGEPSNATEERAAGGQREGREEGRGKDTSGGHTCCVFATFPPIMLCNGGTTSDGRSSLGRKGTPGISPCGKRIAWDIWQCLGRTDDS